MFCLIPTAFPKVANGPLFREVPAVKVKQAAENEKRPDKEPKKMKKVHFGSLFPIR